MGGQLSACGMCCNKRDIMQKGTYIFHYGGTSPSTLAQRLSQSVQEIIARAIPCVVKGYVLAFAGKSKQWNMKSIATLYPQKGFEVRGYCILHNEREQSILNTFNGYPLSYDRVNVLARVTDEPGDMLSKAGHACLKEADDPNGVLLAMEQREFTNSGQKSSIVAEAFIKNKCNNFINPDEKYLIECCKTQFTYMQLKKENIKQVNEIVIDIRMGSDGRMHGEFRYPILKANTE